MAHAIRRPGRFVDYFVECTPARTMTDLTSPTLHDPLAAEELPPCPRVAIDPPVPVYEAPRASHGPLVALAALMFGGAVLDALVRLVIAVGR